SAPATGDSPLPSSATIFGLILAGGRGTRLGGVDKGRLRLGNRPLVALCATRLAPQVHSLWIARSSDDGWIERAFPILPDRADGPSGPAAALWSAIHALSDSPPSTLVVTSAVDTPLLPDDFVQRGAAAMPERGPAGVAVGCFAGRPYYTQAVWRLDALRAALAGAGSAPALHRLAGKHWLPLSYEGADNPFANVNTLADLRQLSRLFQCGAKGVGKRGRIG